MYKANDWFYLVIQAESTHTYDSLNINIIQMVIYSYF